MGAGHSLFAERPYLLRITATNVFGVPEIRWVNGRLLYFRPALGRLYAVDMVYEVEREQFVYRVPVGEGTLLFK
jgi:hypothetical protein